MIDTNFTKQIENDLQNQRLPRDSNYEFYARLK